VKKGAVFLEKSASLCPKRHFFTYLHVMEDGEKDYKKLYEETLLTLSEKEELLVCKQQELTREGRNHLRPEGRAGQAAQGPFCPQERKAEQPGR
jgi:hypothetical protein